MQNNKQSARDKFVSQGNTNRVISGLQVDPEGVKRIMGRQDTNKARASAVFWIGCNLPRTSHLVLTIEELFDRLEWDIAVIDGPENCCGIVHFREGDNDTGGKIDLRGQRCTRMNRPSDRPASNKNWRPRDSQHVVQRRPRQLDR